MEDGQKHSNIRSITMGYIGFAISHTNTGNLPAAIEAYQKAIEISVDPVYSLYSKGMLGPLYLLSSKIQEAETILQETRDACQSLGYGISDHDFRAAWVRSSLATGAGSVGRG